MTDLLRLAAFLLVALVLGGGSWAIRRWWTRVHRELFDALTDLRKRLGSIEAAGVLHADDGRAPLPYSKAALTHDAVLRAVTDIHLSRCQCIVEFGPGCSTVFLAQCCRAMGTGHVIAFEHDRWWAAQVRSFLAERDLSPWITVVEAPLEPLVLDGQTYQWYARASVEQALQGKSVDYVIVDGPPGHLGPCARYPALPVIRPYLHPDARIVLDDGSRRDEREIAERWTREFRARKAYWATVDGVWQILFSPPPRPPNGNEQKGQSP